MIRSMTGYGKGSAEAAGLRATVELRSVNNRFADLKLRVPPDLAAEEADIRRALLARVRRGRVEMSLALERDRAEAAGIDLDRGALERLVAAARAARDEFGVAGELDLRAVLAVPEVLRRAAAPAGLDAAGRAAVRRALDAALDALETERAREGGALRDEIVPRLDRMLALVAAVRDRAAQQPAAVRTRLEERIAALVAPSVPVDPARLAQEVAFLADRCDVTEELVRLESHLRQARDLLARPDGDPVGKKLDFLLQEIHRETNTINSKSGDLEISRRALDLKSEAEKVREQVQNLE
jgi:uncharacterized protein (TIGR00255 family)